MTPDGPSPAPTLEENRREHQRHGVLINVRVQDEEKLRDLYATDLSAGGIFVATRSEMPLGQTLDVLLVHPLTEATLQIGCEVANVRRSEEGEVRGCGLRFTSFDEAVQGQLSDFVEGVVELEPEEDLELVEEVPPPMPPAAPKKEARTHSMLLQARQLSREGNLVGAAHVLQRATALDPADDTLWATLREIEAAIAATAKRSDEVEEELAVDIDVDDFEDPDGESEGPVVLLEEVAAIEPADRRKCKLLFEAAKDCYGTGEMDDAIHYLEKCLGSDPTFVPAYCALAKIIADEKGDADRAAFLCNKALEHDPDNDKANATLASIGAK